MEVSEAMTIQNDAFSTKRLEEIGIEDPDKNDGKNLEMMSEFVKDICAYLLKLEASLFSFMFSVVFLF